MYESKIFIINRNIFEDRSGKFPDYVYPNIIAIFNMCSMPESFAGLFKTEIDYAIYGDDDADMTVDKYGDKCKYSHLQPVLEWLTERVKEDAYRRLKPFMAFLEAVKEDEWDEIQIVHYGY